MQAIEEFASSLRLGSCPRDEQWDNLLETISGLIVGHRPGRREKREIKRRPKNYRLMTCPRNPNRNRYANAASAYARAIRLWEAFRASSDRHARSDLESDHRWLVAHDRKMYRYDSLT